MVALAAVRGLVSPGDIGGEIWTDHDFIRRWYFSKIIQAGSSQASNYKIGQDFTALRLYTNEGITPHVEDVVLNPEIVLKLKPSDVRYRALQNIFTTTIRQDLITGSNITSDSVVHDHHIYPRNANKAHGLDLKMVDSVCNRIPILGTSNQALNEAYPQTYFKDLVDKARSQGTLDGLDRRLRDCMIPGDPHVSGWEDNFSIEKFEEFCEKRADLIISRIQEVVGDSLKISSLSEDEVAEEDED